MIDDFILFITNVFGFIFTVLIGAVLVQGFTMNEVSLGEMILGLILCTMVATVPLYYFYLWAKEK